MQKNPVNARKARINFEPKLCMPTAYGVSIKLILYSGRQLIDCETR